MKFKRIALACALVLTIGAAKPATISGVPASAIQFPVILMETDIAAVTAGGADYGWVSGSPASAAPSTNPSILFDLGPNWAQYSFVSVVVSILGPSTTVANFQIFSRDDAVNAINNNRRRGLVAGTVVTGNFISASITPGVSNGLDFIVRPMGRYLVVAFSNTDASNATGATSKISVAAYPN